MKARALAGLTLAATAALARPAVAQPTIPSSRLPTTAAASLTQALGLLYSSDPVVRAEATWTIGDHGSEAVAAIPFLLSMSGDGAPIRSFRSNARPIEDKEPLSSPSKEAAFALF